MGTVSEHPYDEAVQVLLVTSVEVTMVVRLRSSTLTLATMPAMDHVTGSVSPGAYSELASRKRPCSLLESHR